MGLFSKLFTRDDEAPEGAERAGEAAQPAPAQAETAPRAAAAGKAEPAERAPAAPPAPAAQQAAPPATPRATAPQIERKPLGQQAPLPSARKGTGTAIKGIPQVNAAPPAAAAALPPIAPAAKQAPAPAAAAPKQPAAASAPRAQPLPQRKSKATPRGTAEPAAPRAGSRPQPAAEKLPPKPVAEERPPAVSLEAAVEAAVDELLDHRPRAGNGAALSDGDRHAVTETFINIAQVHAQHVREFMFQLSMGRTPRQWPAVCRAVVQPLIQAARQIELPELLSALEVFDAGLERAANGTSAYVGGAAAEALQAAYAQLTLRMPEVFAATALGDGKRRLMLLEALLLQVPALRRRAVAKLYAAGLTSLEQLTRAAPDEISAVAGIDRALAEAVVQRIERFERDRSRVDPTALRAHVHVRLRTLLARLDEIQSDFERAEQDEASDRKRAARRARELAALELDQLFAELGELELIEELKRCPVRGKIRRIESYLEQAAAPA